MEERGGGRRRRVPAAVRHPGHGVGRTPAVLGAQARWCTEVRPPIEHGTCKRSLMLYSNVAPTSTIAALTSTPHLVPSPPPPQRRPHLPHLPRRRHRRGAAVPVLLHGHAGRGAQELPGEVAVVLQHQLLRALPHGVQHRAAAAAAHRGTGGGARWSSETPSRWRSVALERLNRLSGHDLGQRVSLKGP